VEAHVPSGADAQRSSSAESGGDLDRRHQMLATLEELLGLAGGLIAESTHRNLAAARARVDEDRFNLVVLGEFKRGKSTLINALLEREVLPIGVVPLTSVVTAIGAGERDRLVIRYTDGREEDRPLADLADYVTEARNPENRLGVELARIALDNDLLQAGLEIVDTPGIGSIHSHNTQVARDFLPRVDAAIGVLDAGQPLSEGERQLFVEAVRRVPRLLMVVNKIDHLDDDDRPVAVEFVRAALRELLREAEPELFAVSARRREGIGPLLARLRRLASEERQALLLRSVAGLASSVALDTAQAARFESHAIELPLEELTARSRLFEERIGELRAASAEAGDLLDRGISRAIEETINVPLKEHSRKESARLRTALRQYVQELGRRSPRELSNELEVWIDATVREDFGQLIPLFESSIADQLTELERRYAGRVQRILEQVQEVAEDVFGARASDVLPEAGLRAPSRFSFKLKDVEHALDILVGFGRTVTPGALGRRLVLRDAEQRLIEMTDRHAGRLRSELASRVSEAARAYHRELSTAVKEAIDAIRAAIDRAGDDRRRGEQHTHARLEQLAQIERRCSGLAEQLAVLAAGGRPARISEDL
jgi:ribosome biogenesis GTPase A